MISSPAGRFARWAAAPGTGPIDVSCARLSRKLVSVVGRVDYARVRISGTSAEPLAISGASVLSSVTRADGFVIVPVDSEGYPEGADVEVYLVPVSDKDE